MTIVFYNGVMFAGDHDDMVDLVCDLTTIDPHASIRYEIIEKSPAHT